jgi:2-polyprenyl-6-methoxyphenol hydroxylase-like FAD-dependent oxidoreductase
VPLMRETEVAIVGGGPVGLTLAIELRRQGVACALVERRPAPGHLPRTERCDALAEVSAR